MSRTTNAILEKEWEEERKKEALFDLPDSIEENNQLIEELKKKVLHLQSENEKKNSFKERYKNYVIGGIIGALISTLLTFFL